MKLYFTNMDDEMCFPISSIKDMMRLNGVSEIEAIEAKPDNVHEYFWCRAVDEVCENGECGKCCIHYEPKNSISGMCRHKSRTYSPSGNKIIIKL